MSHALFSLNEDLRQLREAGYSVQRVGGFLVMREVPYVNAAREIKRGAIISDMCLSGDRTQKPEPHTVHFDGEFPCNAQGDQLSGIGAGSAEADLGHGLRSRHIFSSKPGPQGYSNYFEKMSTYASILAGPAAVLDPTATPRVYREPDPEEESVFNYVETASDRVGIGHLTAKFKGARIAILGLGGTGAYVIDQVAKTQVAEIRIIDGDEFLQHNAFRAPGAPSIETLREVPKKVDYYAALYSKMHRGITAHAVAISAETIHLLDGVSFAFLCMDAGEAKRLTVEKLEKIGVSFIDVGMGLTLDSDSLGGILRVSTSTPEDRATLRSRVSFTGGGADDIYATNIQVADLNMLNAALAVIKWKKLVGFYRDLEKEVQSTYTTDSNQLDNKGPE
jgi:hypothetical protein